MRAIRPRWFTVLATAAFLVFAAPAMATTVAFDTVPPADGTAIVDQYENLDPTYLGFTFNAGADAGGTVYQAPVVTNVGAGAAHSGNRVLAFTGSNNGEPGNPSNLWWTFDTPRSSVSFFLRQATSSTAGTTFMATGYGPGGAQVAQTTPLVQPGHGYVQVTLSSPNPADAASLIQDVKLTGGSGSSADTYDVDDLSYSDPPPGAPAPAKTFTLIAAATATGSIPVQQGGSATGHFTIARHGGSTGAIGFTASGLPTGVTASFTPSSADTGDRSVSVTFSAAEDAAVHSTPIPVTITPQPSGSAGTGAATTLDITVTPDCVAAPTFSVVHFEAMNGGCFHPAGISRPNDLDYAGNEIKLNGLVVNVANLVVTPNAHRIAASDFNVLASNLPPALDVLPLYAGPINVTIPDPASSDDAVPFVGLSTDMIQAVAAPFQPRPSSSDSSAASNDGSSSSGGSGGGDDDKPSPGSLSAMINLTSSGAEAPIGITFPSALGGISAEATLKWKTATGYDPNSGFKIKVPSIPLGPITLGPLELDHSGDGDWEGTAGVKLPDPINVNVQGTLGFGSIGSYHGLKRLAVSVSGLNVPFVAGSTLDSIQFGFGFNQQSFEFMGGLGVKWGPRVAGHSAVEVDGSLDLKLGYSDLTSSVTGQPYYPFDIGVHADVKLADVPVGSGDLEIAQDDQGFTFRLAAELGLGLPYHAGTDPQAADFFLGGHILFWVQPPNFDGEAGLELKVLGVNIASADALISNVGFGVCGHILFFTGGAGKQWGHDLNIMGPFGCDISDYRPTYRTPNVNAVDAAAGASHTLHYPSGSKPVFLKLYGSHGTPKVTLAGPGGRKLVMPTTGTKPILNHQFVVLQQPSAGMTFIAINHPAGTWKLTPEPGSPPITKALGATTMPEPHVVAHVVGSGYKRAIVYHAKRLPRQMITFTEIGRRTHRVIRTVTALSGRIPFTPGDGPKGSRKVQAVVYINKMPRKQFTVARYRAPNPKAPVDPSNVKVSRAANGNVIVGWHPGTEVANYRVTLTLSDGTRLFASVPARHHSTTFVAIPLGASVTATVQAERTNGGLGAIVKPGPAKKHCTGKGKRRKCR